MQFRVQLIRDEAVLGTLEEAWTDLLLSTPLGTVFGSAEWNRSWWRHFGAGKRLFVLAVYDGADQLAGLAPLMRRQAGPVRKLEFIGTGLSDSGDFVLRPACAREVTNTILAYLRAHRHDWDLLDLDEIPPYSPLIGFLRGRPSGELRSLWLERSDNPFIALPATWEDYRRSLLRRHRSVFERRMRQISTQEAVELRVVREAEQVGPAVAALYRLHLARWAGKDEALEGVHLAPNFAAFLDQVSSRLAACGRLRLLELRAGEQVIASSLSFLVNGHWNGYLKGFDPRWANKGPGQVLDTYAIQQACAEHVRDFDFGRGNEEYKYRFGATNRKNWRLLLASSTARSTVGLLLAKLRIRGHALRVTAAAARAARAGRGPGAVMPDVAS